MIENDRAYYRQRADTETHRAEAASSPEVVHIHYQLAKAYLERLAGDAAEPAPRA